MIYDGKNKNSQALSGILSLNSDNCKLAATILHNLPVKMDIFLNRWAARMKASAYASFTTARKNDCEASFYAFYNPILQHLAAGVVPTFEILLQNKDNWAGGLLYAGDRHLQRGVTVEMYLGCFKTFIYAIFDALDTFDETHTKNIACAKEVLTLYGHALEVLWVKRCFDRPFQTNEQQDCEIYRLLALEKCRFENVLNLSGSAIILIDAKGKIITHNKVAHKYLGKNRILGKPIWQVLEIELKKPQLQEFLKKFGIGKTSEFALPKQGNFFDFSIVPLGEVSLVSEEYLVTLSDITEQVVYRESLKKTIASYKQALDKGEKNLEEMNITLRNVIKNMKFEQQELYGEALKHLCRKLWPALSALQVEANPEIRKNYSEMLRGTIEDILNYASNGQSYMFKLTQAELNVARLIKEGDSSKKIAEKLHISFETVQTHRRNIRKKLDISGKGVQLASCLKDSLG